VAKRDALQENQTPPRDQSELSGRDWLSKPSIHRRPGWRTTGLAQQLRALQGCIHAFLKAKLCPQTDLEVGSQQPFTENIE